SPTPEEARTTERACRVVGAEAYRIDSHASIHCLLSRVQGRRPGSGYPVGQHNDDVGRVSSFWYGLRFAACWRAISVGRRNGWIYIGYRIERLENAAADGRPAPRTQALNGYSQGIFVGRWGLDQLRVTGERDNADLRARSLVFNELKRGFLGCFQPAGFD